MTDDKPDPIIIDTVEFFDTVTVYNPDKDEVCSLIADGAEVVHGDGGYAYMVSKDRDGDPVPLFKFRPPKEWLA